MTFTPGSGTSGLLLTAATCAVLTLVASCSGPARPPAATKPAVASGRPSAPVPVVPEGWKSIENRGVQVDVPTGWERADMSGCEFEFAQWTPTGADPCRLSTGLAFYGSATFDPFQGPEVQRSRGDRWSGYVYSGGFAVYVVGADREIVQDVLGSVRPRASNRP